MNTDYEDIAGGGSFAKFDEVGDKVEGTVIACGIDTATDYDNVACLSLMGNERARRQRLMQYFVV